MLASVVILNYKTADLTGKAVYWVQEAAKRASMEIEIIVVDNASGDGSAEKIKSAYPAVTMINAETNLGFARGNNLGMSRASGEYLVLLNSDCFVEENALEQIWTDQSAIFGKYDVVGIRLLNPDGTGQPSWGYFPTLMRIFLMMSLVDNLPIARSFMQSIHVRDEMAYNEERPVDWVTGAMVVMKKEVYEKTGGFDENFFMYGEEVEWMYRIRQAGYKIGYTPAARAVHLGGASSDSKLPAVLGEMKGWEYWFKKHNPGWQQKVLPWLMMYGCGLRMAVFPKRRKVYQQALQDIWTRVRA